MICEGGRREGAVLSSLRGVVVVCFFFFLFYFFLIALLKGVPELIKQFLMYARTQDAAATMG